MLDIYLGLPLYGSGCVSADRAEWLRARELLEMKRSRTQSEFGGRSGLIQSVADGHIDLTPSEARMALVATDPADEGSVPDRENVGEQPRKWD